MHNQKNIILASSSEARKNLLNQLKLKFSSHTPEIDETPLHNEKPQALALRLAAEKAKQCAQQLKQTGLYIGSDQVAWLEDGDNSKQLNKPYTVENAIEQLSLC